MTTTNLGAKASPQPRFWQVAAGPLIGLVIAIILVRAGLKEVTHFHYWLDNHDARNNPAHRTADTFNERDQLTNRDPRLEDEPAIRGVTWFGLPIATEYAGLDDRAFYPSAPWYHLPSHWSLRLQVLFGLFGVLTGWLISQQRAIGKLQRQLRRLHQAS